LTSLINSIRLYLVPFNDRREPTMRYDIDPDDPDTVYDRLLDTLLD
jgi:hypothetical protein